MGRGEEMSLTELMIGANLVMLFFVQVWVVAYLMSKVLGK